MKKKWIVILAISLPVIVFVISFSLFELYKKIYLNNSKCLNQQTLDIPFEISNLTKDLCITTYTTGKSSIHIEVDSNVVLNEKLIQYGWVSFDANTYKKGKYSLDITDEIITITEITTSTNINTETDSSSPELVIAEPEISSTYQVTSKEISKINTTAKIVVFTFDGGSGTQSMDQILNILAKYNLTGTFFLTGKWAETNITDVKRISNAGHEIFNHTYSHPDLATVDDNRITEEFQKTETILKDITGKSTKPFFRPPYGSRNSHIRELAASLGYQDIYWTIDALDWKESTGTTAETVKSRILDNLAPGNIYLMHIGDNLVGQVLDEVISQIQERGYTIMSLYDAVTTYK